MENNPSAKVLATYGPFAELVEVTLCMRYEILRVNLGSSLLVLFGHEKLGHHKHDFITFHNSSYLRYTQRLEDLRRQEVLFFRGRKSFNYKLCYGLITRAFLS